MRVLIITSEWPDSAHPHRVPFLVRQVELLRERGVEVEVFPFSGKKNPWNYLRAMFRVHQFLRKNQVDLIHAQWGQSAVPVFFSSLPLVITFRGSDIHGEVKRDGYYSRKSHLLRFVSRLVARRANKVIVVDEGMKKFLPRGVADKAEVIPSGIDLKRFRPLLSEECRRKLRLPLNGKIILFGGNPQRPVKRFNLAEKACAILRQSLDAELIALNNVPSGDVPYYINAADVVLLTSAHEGSPNIVKEALACNRPVVSVDVGDVRERIASLKGCYVTDDNPEAIAAALLRSLNVRQPLDLRSSVLQLEENRITDQIIEVYRKVLNGSTGSLA